MSKVVILPANNDLNRGDQALIWETVDIARRSGLDGDFYMLAENESLTKQSQSIGIKVITPLLKHPSRKFKTIENTKYDLKLLIKWGSVAVLDAIFSVLLLSKMTSKLIWPFLNKADKKTLMTIKDCDACFVKGGGFIHSTGKITDPYTVYYLLYHIILAQTFNKPIYVMPNSFGPFKGVGVEWLVRKVLNKCKVVTVRESVSKEMLDNIGVNSLLFPDLGFFLKKINGDISLSIIKRKHPNKKFVAITARPYRFPKSDNPKQKYKKYIDTIVEFSKWLSNQGFLPIFVEQVLSETSHESDITAITEITSRLQDDEYEILSNIDFNCRDLKNIYSQMDYTLGTRFHSVIFSISENIPSIAIEYGGNKGAGILKDIGLSKFGIPIEDVTFDRLKTSFEVLLEEKIQVERVIQKYMAQAYMNRTELIDLIRRG